jgi:hypothetical protein
VVLADLRARVLADHVDELKGITLSFPGLAH